MPAPDLFLLLKKKWSEHGRTLDLTLRTLTLGSADLTTGWYSKSFNTSTIQMAILYKATQRSLLHAGIFMSQEAVGITKTAVREGDEILDANANTFTVLAVHDHNILDQFMFNQCDLKLQAQGTRAPSSWNVWSGAGSPFERLVRATEKNAAHSSTVTFYALALGAVDAVTGWYAKSYALGVAISCVILDKSASNQVLRPLGLYTEYKHAGFTQADINQGDIIKDYVGALHRIRNATPRVIADKLAYQDLELEQIEVTPCLDAALIPDFMLSLRSYVLGEIGDEGSGEQGTITEDGHGYALPNTHADSKIPHAILWNPPSIDFLFDHWEGSANVTFDDYLANPTNANILSGSTGMIEAIFAPPTVELYATLWSPCDPTRCTLTILTDVYYGPWPKTDLDHASVQTVLATFGRAYEELDHWESTGAVAIDDIHANPCVITVTGNGTLTCVGRSIDVLLTSINDADPSDVDKGKIGFSYDGITYFWYDPLPQTSYGWPRGTTYPWQWDPKASGATFVRWETTGAIILSDPYANPVVVTINGAGTLRAVYLWLP